MPISCLIEVKNEEGQTALLLACSIVDLEMIRLLLHYEANLQAIDVEGRGALTFCLLRFPRAPMQAASAIRLLGDHGGILWNATDRITGWAPLHYLVEAAFKAPLEAEPLFTYLIQKGGNPDLVDYKGNSPLDHAVAREQERDVAHMIRLGAGRTLNVPAARAFFDARPHLKDVYACLKRHSLLLRWELALAALRRLSSGSQGKLKGAQLGEIALPPGLARKLIDGEGNILSQSSYGRRNVGKLSLPDGYELYFKQYPEMPGVEYAINTLFKLLIGHGTSFTDFARLSSPNGTSYPVLLSQGIQGQNFHDILSDPNKAEQVEKLNPQAFSELVLASLLVNFEDAKPDNFIMELLPDGSYCLVGIDNDHAFVPPLVKDKGKKTVQVKCILYCLDLMKKPLHPCAKERFLSLCPESVLSLWLKDLQQQNQRYCSLFTETERKALFSNSKDHDGMVISIPFKPGAVTDIYQKFKRLQMALQDSPELTGLEALRVVIPELGIRYEEAFRENTPLDRFLSLTKSQYSIAMAGRLQTRVNSQQMLKSMAITDKEIWKGTANQGPDSALNELESLQEEMHATDQKLKRVRDALQGGNVNPFNQLQLDYSKEKVINGIPGVFEGIDFKAMQVNGQPNLPHQQKVLETILTGNYRSLRLSGCTVLNTDSLSKLANKSPQLLFLELDDCSKVDESFLSRLNRLNYLSSLTLENLPLLKQISLPHATLRTLQITNCPGLQRLTITDTLRSLSIDTCFNLRDIQAKTYAGEGLLGRLIAQKTEMFVHHLQLKACPQLQPWWGIFGSWLKELPTRKIELEDAPLNPSSEFYTLSLIAAVLGQPEDVAMLSALSDYYPYKADFINTIKDLFQNIEPKTAVTCYKIYLFNQNNILNVTPFDEVVTDQHLQILANELAPTIINLSECNRITDSGLQTLVQSCPYLTYVDLQDCQNITDEGLEALASGCPELSTVMLSSQNTIKGLRTLLNKCPKLHKIKLNREIWGSEFEKLRRSYSNIKFEYPPIEFPDIDPQNRLSID